MKSPKCYELYWQSGKPTCLSRVYGSDSYRVTQVAAYSIKQAYYIASKRIWYDGVTGIVAEASEKRMDGKDWRLPDGTYINYRPYRHGTAIKKH